MNDLNMYDASYPPHDPPAYAVTAFYIGGDTPHPWTDAEIARIKSEFGLPIWVNTFPDADPVIAGQAIVSWLLDHGWRKRTAVAVDTEDVLMNPFLTGLNNWLEAAGWLLLHYQSKGEVADSTPTTGGRWVADWTGQPHRRPGDTATQYLPASMSGLDYDQSLIDATLPLHQLHRPPPPPVPLHPVEANLPALYLGTSGHSVRVIQGLLNAANSTGGGQLDIDGEFGPLTERALVHFQHQQVAAFVPGVAGPHTWERLLTW